jgi:hypothetical protein
VKLLPLWKQGSMSKRKRPVEENPSESLLKFREKRKWQIALRRYVLEEALCVAYAPYFGLDIKNLRQWFECQFNDGASWENFGVLWQFDHIIPVAYFDFSVDDELKLCWNFTNIRVDHFQTKKESGNRLDVLAAKNYFKELYNQTNYNKCQQLLNKIDQIELSERVSTKEQTLFLNKHKSFLNKIENYTSYAFSLLNSGKTMEDINKELAFIEKNNPANI